MKVGTRIRRPVFVSLTLASALLLNLAAPAICSLAAYTETRSFRDALDGRSMEEALSGPVDKDTSSYGERATATSATASDSQSANMMPLSIPANGNLNGAGNKNGVEQQRSADSGDSLTNDAGALERETNPVDQQRQLKGARLMGRQSNGARQMQMNGASQRAPVQQMVERQSEYEKRPQQQMAAFGQPADQASGYGQSTMVAGNGATQEERNGQHDEQQQKQEEAPEQQEREADRAQQGAERLMAMMMMMQAGKQQQRANGYGAELNGRAQRQAAVMRTAAQTSEHGARSYQPSSMAQSMMMSLANKAAYANGQQRQMPANAGRQMAPPIMQAADDGQQQAMAAPDGASMSGTNGMNGYSARSTMGAIRGGMRRANQRRQEKKMSPAMVNTLLNKMLGRQMNGADNSTLLATGQSDNYAINGNGNGASQRPIMTDGQMAQMMRSPAGQEMLADMMMATGGLQAYGNEQQMANGQSAGSSKGAYKRMLMEAMMEYQQQQQQQQQQQVDEQEQEAGMQRLMAPNYGDRQPSTMGKAAMRAKQGNNREYGGILNGQSGAQMPNTIDQQQMNYNGNQQQRETTGEESELKNGANDNAGAAGAYERANGATMRPTMSIANKASMYGRPMAGAMRLMNGAQTGAYRSNQAANGMSDQQRQIMMRTMAMAQAMSNGIKLGQDYGSPEQQQPDGDAQNYGQNGQTLEQRPLSEGTKSAESNSMLGQNGFGMNKPNGQQYAQGAMDTKPKSNYGVDEQDEQQQQLDGPAAGQAEPFAFNYNIDDNYGNQQYRKEESDKNGVVRGSYGYMDMSGIYRHVEYVADENGFRAKIKSNEPGLNGGSAPAKQQPQAPQQAIEPTSQANGEAQGPQTAQPPPSTSSSLGGSAMMAQQQQQQQKPMKLQTDTQLPMTPLMDADMQQQQLSAGGNQEGRKGQYSATVNDMQRQQPTAAS